MDYLSIPRLSKDKAAESEQRGLEAKDEGAGDLEEQAVLAAAEHVL